MFRKSKSSDYIKVSLPTISVVLVIAGLLLVIITAFEWGTNSNSGWFVLKNILIAVGTTLFSSGVVSLIVEFSSIHSAVDNAVKNILSCDIPLENYSTSNLNKLKQAIACTVSGNGENIEKIENSVYKLEPELLNLVNGLYYDYHTITCEVAPHDKNGYFKKTVTINYKVINNYELDNSIKLSISLYDLHKNMTEQERLDSFKIIEFKINKTNLISECDKLKSIKPIVGNNAYEYDYIVCFERELQKCREHDVTIKYEYLCSEKDLIQSWRLALPCRHIKHTICIKNSSKWLMRVNAFASFYCNKSELAKKFDVQQNVHNNCTIEFNEWTIPGAGYVISYNKK